MFGAAKSGGWNVLPAGKYWRISRIFKNSKLADLRFQELEVGENTYKTVCFSNSKPCVSRIHPWAGMSGAAKYTGWNVLPAGKYRRISKIVKKGPPPDLAAARHFRNRVYCCRHARRHAHRHARRHGQVLQKHNATTQAERLMYSIYSIYSV